MSSTSSVKAGEAYVKIYADKGEFDRNLKETETSFAEFGNKTYRTAKTIAKTLGMVGLPLAVSVRSFVEFDDAMRTTKAVTNASAFAYKELREEASRLGATTSFTASQVAKSMAELGRIGFNHHEILAAQKEILNLSRATGTDLTRATEIAGNAIRAFRIDVNRTAKDANGNATGYTAMTGMIDRMVTVANKSSQTLEDLGNALRYVSTSSVVMEQEIDSTLKSLALLANMGIKGEQAGTSMRNMLMRMSDPNVQKFYKELGVDIEDSEGKIRNLYSVLLDVRRRFEETGATALQQARYMKNMFSLRAAQSGASLMTADIESIEKAIDNCAGVAARTSATIDAGLGGTFRRLKSVAEQTGNSIVQDLEGRITVYAERLSDRLKDINQFVEANKKTVSFLAEVGTNIGIAAVGIMALGQSYKMYSSTIAQMRRGGSAFFDLSDHFFKKRNFKSEAQVLRENANAIIAKNTVPVNTADSEAAKLASTLGVAANKAGKATKTFNALAPALEKFAAAAQKNHASVESMSSAIRDIARIGEAFRQEIKPLKDGMKNIGELAKSYGKTLEGLANDSSKASTKIASIGKAFRTSSSAISNAEKSFRSVNTEISKLNSADASAFADNLAKVSESIKPAKKIFVDTRDAVREMRREIVSSGKKLDSFGNNLDSFLKKAEAFKSSLDALNLPDTSKTNKTSKTATSKTATSKTAETSASPAGQNVADTNASGIATASTATTSSVGLSPDVASGVIAGAVLGNAIDSGDDDAPKIKKRTPQFKKNIDLIKENIDVLENAAKALASIQEATKTTRKSSEAAVRYFGRLVDKMKSSQDNVETFTLKFRGAITALGEIRHAFEEATDSATSHSTAMGIVAEQYTKLSRLQNKLESIGGANSIKKPASRTIGEIWVSEDKESKFSDKSLAEAGISRNGLLAEEYRQELEKRKKELDEFFGREENKISLGKRSFTYEELIEERKKVKAEHSDAVSIRGKYRDDPKYKKTRVSQANYWAERFEEIESELRKYADGRSKETAEFDSISNLLNRKNPYENAGESLSKIIENYKNDLEKEKNDLKEKRKKLELLEKKLLDGTATQRDVDFAKKEVEQAENAATNRMIEISSRQSEKARLPLQEKAEREGVELSYRARIEEIQKAKEEAEEKKRVREEKRKEATKNAIESDPIGFSRIDSKELSQNALRTVDQRYETDVQENVAKFKESIGSALDGIFDSEEVADKAEKLKQDSSKIEGAANELIESATNERKRHLKTVKDAIHEYGLFVDDSGNEWKSYSEYLEKYDERFKEIADKVKERAKRTVAELDRTIDETTEKRGREIRLADNRKELDEFDAEHPLETMPKKSWVRSVANFFHVPKTSKKTPLEQERERLQKLTNYRNEMDAISESMQGRGDFSATRGLDISDEHLRSLERRRESLRLSLNDVGLSSEERVKKQNEFRDLRMEIEDVSNEARIAHERLPLLKNAVDAFERGGDSYGFKKALGKVDAEEISGDAWYRKGGEFRAKRKDFLFYRELSKERDSLIDALAGNRKYRVEEEFLKEKTTFKPSSLDWEALSVESDISERYIGSLEEALSKESNEGKRDQYKKTIQASRKKREIALERLTETDDLFEAYEKKGFEDFRKKSETSFLRKKKKSESKVDPYPDERSFDADKENLIRALQGDGNFHLTGGRDVSDAHRQSLEDERSKLQKQIESQGSTLDSNDPNVEYLKRLNKDLEITTQEAEKTRSRLAKIDEAIYERDHQKGPLEYIPFVGKKRSKYGFHSIDDSNKKRFEEDERVADYARLKREIPVLKNALNAEGGSKDTGGVDVTEKHIRALTEEYQRLVEAGKDVQKRGSAVVSEGREAVGRRNEIIARIEGLSKSTDEQDKNKIPDLKKALNAAGGSDITGGVDVTEKHIQALYEEYRKLLETNESVQKRGSAVVSEGREAVGRRNEIIARIEGLSDAASDYENGNYGPFEELRKSIDKGDEQRNSFLLGRNRRDYGEFDAAREDLIAAMERKGDFKLTGGYDVSDENFDRLRREKRKIADSLRNGDLSKEERKEKKKERKALNSEIKATEKASKNACDRLSELNAAIDAFDRGDAYEFAKARKKADAYVVERNAIKSDSEFLEKEKEFNALGAALRGDEDADYSLTGGVDVSEKKRGELEDRKKKLSYVSKNVSYLSDEKKEKNTKELREIEEELTRVNKAADEARYRFDKLGASLLKYYQGGRQSVRRLNAELKNTKTWYEKLGVMSKHFWDASSRGAVSLTKTIGIKLVKAFHYLKSAVVSTLASMASSAAIGFIFQGIAWGVTKLIALFGKAKEEARDFSEVLEEIKIESDRYKQKSGTIKTKITESLGFIDSINEREKSKINNASNAEKENIQKEANEEREGEKNNIMANYDKLGVLPELKLEQGNTEEANEENEKRKKAREEFKKMFNEERDEFESQLKILGKVDATDAEKADARTAIDEILKKVGEGFDEQDYTYNQSLVETQIRNNLSDAEAHGYNKEEKRFENIRDSQRLTDLIRKGYHTYRLGYNVGYDDERTFSTSPENTANKGLQKYRSESLRGVFSGLDDYLLEATAGDWKSRSGLERGYQKTPLSDETLAILRSRIADPSKDKSKSEIDKVIEIAEEARRRNKNAHDISAEIYIYNRLKEEVPRYEEAKEKVNFFKDNESLVSEIDKITTTLIVEAMREAEEEKISEIADVAINAFDGQATIEEGKAEAIKAATIEFEKTEAYKNAPKEFRTLVIDGFIGEIIKTLALERNLEEQTKNKDVNLNRDKLLSDAKSAEAYEKIDESVDSVSNEIVSGIRDGKTENERTTLDMLAPAIDKYNKQLNTLETAQKKLTSSIPVTERTSKEYVNRIDEIVALRAQCYEILVASAKKLAVELDKSLDPFSSVKFRGSDLLKQEVLDFEKALSKKIDVLTETIMAEAIGKIEQLKAGVKEVERVGDTDLADSYRRQIEEIRKEIDDKKKNVEERQREKYRPTQEFLQARLDSALYREEYGAGRSSWERFVENDENANTKNSVEPTPERIREVEFGKIANALIEKERERYPKGSTKRIQFENDFYVDDYDGSLYKNKLSSIFRYAAEKKLGYLGKDYLNAVYEGVVDKDNFKKLAEMSPEERAMFHRKRMSETKDPRERDVESRAFVAAIDSSDLGTGKRTVILGETADALREQIAEITTWQSVERAFGRSGSSLDRQKKELRRQYDLVMKNYNVGQIEYYQQVLSDIKPQVELSKKTYASKRDERSKKREEIKARIDSGYYNSKEGKRSVRESDLAALEELKTGRQRYVEESLIQLGDQIEKEEKSILDKIFENEKTDEYKKQEALITDRISTGFYASDAAANAEAFDRSELVRLENEESALLNDYRANSDAVRSANENIGKFSEALSAGVKSIYDSVGVSNSYQAMYDGFRNSYGSFEIESSEQDSRTFGSIDQCLKDILDVISKSKDDTVI